MRVSDFMTRKVVTAAPDDGIRETYFRMREARIRHLPVIDRGDLVGLVSIGDVVKAKTTVWDVEIRHLTDYIEGKYPG